MYKYSLLLLVFCPMVSLAQFDCNTSDETASGRCVTYYSTGDVKEKGKFKKGMRHGKFTTYYITGQKQSEVNYKKGKMNGMYRSYHMNGVLEKFYFVVDDLIQGNYVEYHDNGAIRAEGRMVDSKKVGFWDYKDPFGNIIETVDYDVVKQE